MMDNPLKHGVRICWMYLMRFINNYQIKWLLADLLLIADGLGHGLGAAEYHQIFSVFGIESSTVDAGISALGVVRIAVLLYQRTIES